MQPVPCEYRDSVNLFSGNAPAASRTKTNGTLEAKLFHSASAFSFPVLFFIFVHLPRGTGGAAGQAEAAHSGWPRAAGRGQVKLPHKGLDSQNNNWIWLLR